ncbi:type IV secretion system VirB5/TraC/TraE/TrbJ family protein [Pseudoxanthomonas sp. 3HH-4]|uniref:type IV secretion system protein n=1 Tax=Pseudoxanthomonas sp. 3HH-4 TaxID=1690214 RepID=UPI001154DA68|nr:type IV secretion system protein [Pseudoxanthomonas sp. 3HH-4]TQM17376.1 type IV secretion system VirB5/TraC/TraE/TrbJ family protein [Pseudoxanthomonas sp. 3HH-4]
MSWNYTTSRVGLKRALMPLLIAGFLLPMTDCKASGVPVVDGAHIGINKFAWVAQYRQMYQELQRQMEQYRTQIRELEQKYVNGPSFNGGLGYRETLSERSLNDYVAERCGSGSGLRTGPAQIKDIAERQFRNCVAIIQTENTRYNVMVRILKNLDVRDRQMEELKRQAAGVPADQPGALERVKANIAQLEAYVALDIQNANTLLNAYDASLKALNTEQVWLGQAAFNGKGRGLLDEVVQYGALKGALQVARSRER